MESRFIWDYFDPKVFRGVDLIISCGDLKPEYLSFLVTMIPAPLLYVHGNHDKNYKKKPPLGCQCIDGCLVDFRGIRILGLGGGLLRAGYPQIPLQPSGRRADLHTLWHHGGPFPACGL